MSNSPVGIRYATADDLRFVASTWFHAVLKSGASVNELPYSIFKLGMEANIQELLKRSQTLVAFATAQPDEILGYAVTEVKQVWEPKHPNGGDQNLQRAETTVCHHAYVKSMYRRQGIARSLLGSIKTYTHPATPGAGKKFAVALGLTYNPRLA